MKELANYQILDEISAGLSSKVFKVQSARGSTFALKEYKPQQEHVLQQEKQILEQLDHKNIMKFVETDDASYIIVEYMENGELFEQVQKEKFSEGMARFYAKQLLEALSYLKEKNIAHRDIKLENLMVDENGDLKLIDFGFSCSYDDKENSKVQVGTETYMSPELLTNKPFDLEKSDVFAAGVVIFCMMYGIPPYYCKALSTDPYYKFFCSNKQDVYWKSLRNKLHLEISEEFEDFMNNMICCDQNNRYSLEQALNSKWMQNDNVCSQSEIMEQIELRKQISLQ